MARSLSEMLMSMIPSGDQNMQSQRLAAARAAGQLSPAVAMREGVQFQPNMNRIPAAAPVNAAPLPREQYTLPNAPDNALINNNPTDLLAPIRARNAQDIIATQLPPMPGVKPNPPALENPTAMAYRPPASPDNVPPFFPYYSPAAPANRVQLMRSSRDRIPPFENAPRNMTLRQAMRTFPLAFGMRGMY